MSRFDPPTTRIVGRLPREHGPRYMSKLYSIDHTPLGKHRVQASRWLLWRDDLETGHVQCFQPRRVRFVRLA